MYVRLIQLTFVLIFDVAPYFCLKKKQQFLTNFSSFSNNAEQYCAPFYPPTPPRESSLGDKTHLTKFLIGKFLLLKIPLDNAILAEKSPRKRPADNYA